MAAPRPCSPDVLRKIAEHEGYRVEAETALNWILYKPTSANPLMSLPRSGDVVSFEILHHILGQLSLNYGEYFVLLKKYDDSDTSK